jgi:hypothetical protein
VRAPDIAGTDASAWMVPLDRARAWYREHQGAVPDEGLSNTHAMYYVNGRGFNSTAQWWLIALLDLEQRPRQPAPVFHYGVDPVQVAGAIRMGQRVQPERGKALPQYELLIVTLDSKHGTPPVSGEGPFFVDQRAEPMSFQWHGLSRDESKQIAMFTVEALCAGRACGDLEVMPQRQWQEILVRIVNDYRRGKFGGGVRKPLEIDVYTHRFTGKESEAVPT